MMKKFPGLKKDVSPVWLLAPLVSKLPDHLHLKIHNNATLLLDTGSKFGDEKIENNKKLIEQKNFAVSACSRRGVFFQEKCLK